MAIIGFILCLCLLLYLLLIFTEDLLRAFVFSSVHKSDFVVSFVFLVMDLYLLYILFQNSPFSVSVI